ncbi:MULTISPECIES: dynamin family protein [Paenibacillus]|nr:dynamin family protein [Paenibacillus rhizosphaerae]
MTGEKQQTIQYTTSLQLADHPLGRVKQEIKESYYVALESLVRRYTTNSMFAEARLEQYRTLLCAGSSPSSLSEQEAQKNLRLMINDRLRPWRKRYRYFLIVDTALILCNETAIKQAKKGLEAYLSTRQFEELVKVTELLFMKGRIDNKWSYLEPIIQQYKTNADHAKLPELRILITANMSAGKSTLVNALIGKPVARTSQEACTAHLNYFYSKSFEDGRVHISNTTLKLDASFDDVNKAEATSGQHVATYFTMMIQTQHRLCVIDTPGVNSAMNPEHAKLTRNALIHEKYDKLIYVLNASQLGTDEDMRHLRYVANNVPEEKTIFVLNKLDSFRAKEDSIAESILRVREDLQELGYHNPIICPISAYFSLLLKLKQQGEDLTEDELDDYERLVNKFAKEEFHLSNYYGSASFQDKRIDEVPFLQNSYRSGMLNFEKVLYGGELK